MTFQELMTFLGMKFFQVLMSVLGLITGIGQFFILMLVLMAVSWGYFIYCNVRTRNAD
jgi:hypothetical protein